MCIAPDPTPIQVVVEVIYFLRFVLVNIFLPSFIIGNTIVWILDRRMEVEDQ